MGVKLGDAIVYIRGDSADLNKDLDAAEKKTSGWANKVGSAVQAAGAIALTGIGAAAAGVVAIAREAIPAASNLNESLNASGVVFGEAASIIQDFGKTSAEAIGLSEAAFNQLAAQTGAMLQNYGLNADEAANATVDLGKRAADMASIFNTDVSEAMTAINAAMRGEADPIERFGVSMNMASVEAQALAMGFEKVDGQFEQAALTQARLALLMDQTSSIAGDFANTSDQLANATRVNEARWEDFMAKLGMLGLPIMTTAQSIIADIGDKAFPVVEGAIKNALPFVEKIAEALGNFVGWMLQGEDPLHALGDALTETFYGTALGDAGDTIWNIADAIQNFIGKAQEVIGPITDWLSQNVSLNDVLTGLGVAIGSVIIPAIISIISTIAPIVAIFAGVVLAVALLRKAWESDFMGIRTMFTRVWDQGIKPAFEYAKNELLPRFSEVLQRLGQIWQERIVPALERAGIQMKGDMIPAIGDLLIAIVGLVANGLDKFIDALEWALPYIDRIAQGVGRVIDKFTEWRRTISDLIRNISNLSIPPWLTPGSPTPLELGLIGINKQMGELAKMGNMSIGANMGGQFALAGASAGAGGGGATVGNLNVSFTLQNAPRNEREAQESVDLIRDELRRRGL